MIKKIYILFLILFLTSCGNPQGSDDMNSRDTIVDFAFKLKYNEFHSASEDSNKFSIEYGRTRLEYRKENSKLISIGFDDALIKIGNNYEYLKKELKISVFFTEEDEFVIDGVFFEGSIYVNTQKAFYRIGLNGAQRLYTIDGYNENILKVGDNLVFPTVIDDQVRFIYFTGRNFNQQFSSFTSVSNLISFGAIFSGTGIKDDLSEVSFLNDNQSIFEIIDSNDGSILKNVFSYNGSTALSYDINGDIHRFRGTDTYNQMSLKEISNISYLFHNIFYAKEIASGTFHLYQIDNGGDADILIENIQPNFSNKFHYINNKYYFLVKSEIDLSIKLISYDLELNSYSVISSYQEDYDLYFENNSLYLIKNEGSFQKMYSLNEVYLRDLEKLY